MEKSIKSENIGTYKLAPDIGISDFELAIINSKHNY